MSDAPPHVPGQGALFADAATARELGMARVEQAAGEPWNSYARRFLESYCEAHAEVFCDAVWDAGLVEPPPNAAGKPTLRAFGPVMAHAVRSGWMSKVGYRPSVRSNLAAKPVYQSALYKGQR